MKKIGLVLVAFLWLPIAGSATDQEVVKVTVTGLACPFCVYSLEKNLSKLPEVDCAEVDLAAGLARIVIKAGHSADLERIKQAIVTAGFTPGGAETLVVPQ